MKINHLVNQRKSGRIIRMFGGARLLRYPDGKYELIGGSASDVVSATEWVSLFAHNIVFSRYADKPETRQRTEHGYPAIRSRTMPLRPNSVEVMDYTKAMGSGI